MPRPAARIQRAPTQPTRRRWPRRRFPAAAPSAAKCAQRGSRAPSSAQSSDFETESRRRQKVGEQIVLAARGLAPEAALRIWRGARRPQLQRRALWRPFQRALQLARGDAAPGQLPLLRLRGRRLPPAATLLRPRSRRRRPLSRARGANRRGERVEQPRVPVGAAGRSAGQRPSLAGPERRGESPRGVAANPRMGRCGRLRAVRWLGSEGGAVGKSVRSEPREAIIKHI